MKPGKYDALLKTARESAKAISGVLLIIGGEKGSGMSVQATMDDLERIPAMLRATADSIELQLESGQPLICKIERNPHFDGGQQEITE